jgi:hypothetical protein
MKTVLYLVPALMIAAACTPIPAPTVRPFADSHDWVLVEDLTYQIGQSGVSIKVPKGFVTDFASIPQPLWSIGLSPQGRYSKAAIIHDYLYWTQDCTKDQADNILMIAMQESGVSSTKAREIYAGVHLAGNPSWQSNKIERESKLPRVIPAEYLAIPSDVNWSEYRQFLKSKKVRDPAFQSNSPYCKLGNTSNVPSRG